MRRSLFVRSLVMAVLICAALPTAVESCFITTENRFYLRKRPDASWDQFLSGDLGVIQPTWRDRYLYVAYRELAGVPFTNGESKALADYFAEKEGDIWQVNESDPNYQAALAKQEELRHHNPANQWNQAKDAVLGTTSKELQTVSYQNFAEVVVCPDDAFETAIETLNKRKRDFSSQPELLLDWTKGQEAVFSNCGGKQQDLPAPAPANAPALLKFDREYQQAATSFYTQQWDKAHDAFQRIAKEPSSPWQPWGAYLSARTLIRKSTLGAGEGRFEPEAMKAAETELQEVIRTAKEPKVKRAAVQTMGFVRFRLHPQEYERELSVSLAKASKGDDLVQRLKDYLAAAGPKSYLRYDSSDPENKQSPQVERGGIAEWMRAISADFRWKGEETIARYKSERNLLWLVAALMNANGSESGVDDVLTEAAKVPQSSPAFATVNYHRVRLLRAKGDVVRARAIAREIIPRREISSSTRNLFQQFLAADAESFDEFLASAAARIAGSDTDSYEERQKEPEIRTLPEAAWIFNRELPLGTLIAAVKSEQLDAAVRRELVPAVWTRAILLQRVDEADQVASIAAKLNPKIAPLMDEYIKAPSADEKYRAAWFLIAKTPGMRPLVNSANHRGPIGLKDLAEQDPFLDNWWCENMSERSRALEERGEVKAHPAFLSQAEQAAAAAEWKKLESIGPAPTYLGEAILDWAKKSPDDPRVPEALHRLVRVTRYGCGDKDTKRYSKSAYLVLHDKYPNSEWTKKTKYYFEGSPRY